MWIVAALLLVPVVLRLLVSVATHPIATLIKIVRVITFFYGVGLSVVIAISHQPGQLGQERPLILLAGGFLAVWIATFIPIYLIRGRRQQPTYRG